VDPSGGHEGSVGDPGEGSEEYVGQQVWAKTGLGKGSCRVGSDEEVAQSRGVAPREW